MENGRITCSILITSLGNECDSRMGEVFLALDPGREKVGIAILKKDGSVVFRSVIPLRKLGEKLQELKGRYGFHDAILGGSTGSRAVLPLLERMGLRVHQVDERGSSEEARRLYLEENHLKGWRKLCAFFVFLFSSRTFDDWQAIVIGRRFLERRENA